MRQAERLETFNMDKNFYEPDEARAIKATWSRLLALLDEGPHGMAHRIDDAYREVRKDSDCQLEAQGRIIENVAHGIGRAGSDPITTLDGLATWAILARVVGTGLVRHHSQAQVALFEVHAVRAIEGHRARRTRWLDALKVQP